MSLTGSMAAIRPKRMPWSVPSLIAYSLFCEAEIVQALARVLGRVAMHHQARRHRGGRAEQPRRSRVEHVRLDAGYVQVVMRHPDRSRIDAGENFLELGRVGHFLVGH